ncbi:hypothetical protein B2G71_04410 [Novosphingobium sp. PC22D]|uniref:DUF3311 domain-containing protein n=1 Tax=Novosphingobium sp. PC22D TaxID=1962403 RepID=UPI000BF1A86B|nr:DUF3311 domain-containing protein [Novosphingobium sp. PC22D]PEQ13579.1 hypothetical protein B2G71_04410 [Novosphingobium sp. PC22D]
MTDRRYRHRWLLLLPFLWQVGAVPLVNDIAWRPFSLPFPMVWQMLGILFTTAIIAVVFALDEKAERGDSGADGPTP